MHLIGLGGLSKKRGQSLLTGNMCSVLAAGTLPCAKPSATVLRLFFGTDCMSCRCVVMVGMPYPNPTDPELQERMKFMDSQQQHALRPEEPLPLASLPVHPNTAPHPQLNIAPVKLDMASGTPPAVQLSSAVHNGQSGAAQSGASAGKEYYEDLCLKAVNQCIGRVIRHRGDYAAIILADARWVTGNEGVQLGNGCKPRGPLRKLPLWIQESLCTCRTFGDAYGRLHRFHRQMVCAHRS